MFTGIIQRKGFIKSIVRSGVHGSLIVETDPFDRACAIGDSIAVSGVCLTLTRQEGRAFHFDLLGETFDRTNLGHRKAGDPVNLEPALRYGDPLGGHIVSGHIDGTGTVTSIEPAGDRDHILRIGCAPDLMKFMVQKGSIAMDGVSLTLVDVDPSGFSVHVIPHTWTSTSFAGLKCGDLVNLENDILSKYVRQHRGASGLSWQTLA